MIRILPLFIYFSSAVCFSQNKWPHVNAHSHNDYEHAHPLTEALQNGFNSVEADVHLQDGKLMVAHNRPDKNSSSLERLYLYPLDSLLKLNSGKIYSEAQTSFYLMIDVKTEAEETYQKILQTIKKYPSLYCSPENCPIKIFLSGNRPFNTYDIKTSFAIGLDGRPDDVGKNYPVEMMPVISDNFKNWSHWNGTSKPTSEDLQRIKDLAVRIHAEGKKFRLWAIPDNEIAWSVLLAVGVDLINTDHLKELNNFLNKRGL